MNIDAGSGYSFWASIYGDIVVDNTDMTGIGAAYDSTGNLYVYGRADDDNLALKYKPDGELVWRKSWTLDDGAPCGSFNQEICVQDDKVYFITNSWIGNTVSYVGYHDSEGVITAPMTRIENFQSFDILVDNGNVYTVGRDTIYNRPMAIKLNPETNEIIWSQQITSPVSGFYNCAAIGTDDNLYAIGTVDETAVIAEFNSNNGAVAISSELVSSWGDFTDGQAVGYYNDHVITLVRINNGFILSKFNKSNLTTDIWSIKSEEVNAIDARDISFDGNGFIYVTGSTSNGPTGGDREFYVGKFDFITGAVIWERTFGDNASELDEGVDYTTGTRMAGIYEDRLALTGYTYTNPISGGSTSNPKAITIQIPTNGSGVGTYDQYALSARSYSYTTPSITQTLTDFDFDD